MHTLITDSLAPLKSRGAAQIVLTGDEEFVRTARLAAARHGMYLDEYGLWRWHSSEEAALESQSNADADRRPNAVGSAVAGYWELVEGESEDRILDELELGSIAPRRRNFRFLTSKKRASARAGTLNLSSATLADNVDSNVHIVRRGRPAEGVIEDGDAAVEGVD
jgi:DNA polymerase beta